MENNLKKYVHVTESLCYTPETNTIFSKSIMCVCVRVCSVMSDSLQPHELETTRLLSPWNFPGKSTGVGCHFLLQRIF